MQVTIFSNIKETSVPFYRDVLAILTRVKEGKSKDIVRKIRLEKDKELRNKFKQELPAICFSGTFSKREDSALIEHSGLICLDFDDFPSNDEILAKKDELANDPYTFSVFISPSGNGLKVLVKIPADETKHKAFFNALEAHYNCEQFDKTSKNVSRVCYESYDPTIYVNINSIEWTKIDDAEIDHVTKDMRPTIPIDDENEIINRLAKWWDNKFGFVSGARNNNLFVLAMAFNEYGVSKSEAMYRMMAFASEDFTTKEIQSIIDSAYRHTDKYATKYFEDTSRVDFAKNQLSRGVPKKDIRSQLKASGVEDGTIDSVLTRIEEEQSKNTFWTKSDKGVVTLIHYELKTFLENNGYRKYVPEGNKGFIFVRINQNLIEMCTEDDIKDFVLNHILDNFQDLSVYNYFADKTRFFREDFLSMLDSVSIYFVEDTKDEAYLYFKNGVVKVTKDQTVLLNYEDLGGYVWSDQVIQRDFVFCPSDDCDYKTFIRNIGGADDKRVASIESTIGFVLHAFKNGGYCPAVIINDEVISENPEGGTGKGLFMNGISRMKKAVTIDGKSFSFDKSFAYQLVSTDTQVLVFDDVKKNFDFERLFSVVTEGITVERKNKDAIKIPFHKSPKVVITTNYAIQGKGNSFERRKWEMEFKQFYSKDFTPQDEFGRLLFNDWNQDDWCAFDNYMIKVLQSYLNTGLVKCNFVNLKERKFRAETNAEFAEWAQEFGPAFIPMNQRFRPDDVFDKFIADNNGMFRMLSKQRFNSWLRTYSLHMTGSNPVEGRDGAGKWMVFPFKEDKQLELL
jgi:hypothetical protein